MGADQALLMDILPSGNLTVLLNMTIEIVDLPTKNSDLVKYYTLW